MSVSGMDLIMSTLYLNVTLNTGLYNSEEFSSIRHRSMDKLKRELNGQHLRIGTIENYPLSSYKVAEDGVIIGTGIAFNFVNILQKKFNFTYEVVVPEKNWEGGVGRLSNSLLGLVNSSKVDMAAAFLPILEENRRVVTFSIGLDEGVWLMMMRRPHESAVGSGLLAPFDRNVWYLTLIAVLSYGPCLAILSWLRAHLTKDRHDPPMSLSASFWFVYGSFVKQGTTLAPDANTTRVLFATWWMFIILLSSFYTANLIAFLTLSKFTLGIEKPEDIYKKNYKWGAREGSAIEYVVTNRDEELHYLNRMVNKGRGIFFTQTDDELLLPAVMQGAVLVRDQPAIDLLLYTDYKKKTKNGIAEENRCTFVLVPAPFMKRRRAFAYPKDSKLPILFDLVLNLLVEAGIVNFLEFNQLPDTSICPLDLMSTERRLRNTDLLMTYTLAGIGTISAVAVFIVEFFYKRYVYKQKNTNNNVLIPPKTIEQGMPPPYESIFGSSGTAPGKRRLINGRDYWVIELGDGNTRLIPVRAPSAFLFQYAV